MAATAALSSAVGAVRSLALTLGLADAACWETLAVRLEVLDAGCLKAFVARGLGLGIIAGSCVVKLPQLHKILAHGLAPDAGSVYLEALSSMLAIVWFAAKGVALAEYGENIVLALANVLVVLAVWRLRFPGAQHVALVLAAAAAVVAAAVAATGGAGGGGGGGAAAAAAAAGDAALPLLALQYGFNGIFAAGRLVQIAAIVREGRRAAESLALTSLVLQFAGTAARVFTTWQKVPDAMQILFACANCALNAVVLAQFLALVAFAPAAAAAADPKCAAEAAQLSRAERELLARKEAKGAAAEAAAEGGSESPRAAAAAARRRNVNK